jgi:hypothetical protein
MKTLLALAAVGEAAAGLVLLVYPPIVVRLLFAAEIAGAGVVMSRIAGTSFGAVDGQALEKLQDSFDTTELLRAVSRTHCLIAVALMSWLAAISPEGRAQNRRIQIKV